MERLLKTDELEAAARALITATETNLGIEVTMPVVYPDGQAVMVVVTVEGGQYVVHDAGFGAMYLTNEGVRLTNQVRKRLSAMASHYQCDFIENRMSRRCDVNQIALAIALVANASRSVGDQSLDTRRRSESDFVKVVSSSLRDAVGDRLLNNKSMKGASGRSYLVHNIVLDQAEKSPVAFVETLINKSNVPARFTEFSDLNKSYPEIVKVSIYDENEEIPNADLKLLGEVCEPLTFAAGRKRIKDLAA